jgi:FeS assembly SUF system regulator
MLKLTKKADYGLIAVKHLAERAGEGANSAKDIAERYSLPTEAVAKILQRLTKSGLLVSQHGTNGGYALARDAKLISVFEVIKAIDGPVLITSCITTKGECEQSTKCTVREPLRRVNDGIRELLGRMSIAEMVADAKEIREEPEHHEPAEQKSSELVRLA